VVLDLRARPLLTCMRASSRLVLTPRDPRPRVRHRTCPTSQPARGTTRQRRRHGRVGVDRHRKDRRRGPV